MCVGTLSKVEGKIGLLFLSMQRHRADGKFRESWRSYPFCPPSPFTDMPRKTHNLDTYLRAPPYLLSFAKTRRALFGARRMQRVLIQKWLMAYHHTFLSLGPRAWDVPSITSNRRLMHAMARVKSGGVHIGL